MEVQRVYEQAKAKKEEESIDDDGDEWDVQTNSEYTEALEMLDKIFLQQNNEPYQRQKRDEMIAAFVIRLREQAQFCNFGNSDAVEKALKDQIISGGCSDKVRREMLKRDRPIDEILKLAQSIENVDQFEKATRSTSRCWSCNRTGHLREDVNCPAKSKKCLKCGRSGHFSVCCKSTNKKPRASYRVRAVDDEETEDVSQEYIFQAGESCENYEVRCRWRSN